jgi:hypothetical protein
MRGLGLQEPAGRGKLRFARRPADGQQEKPFDPTGFAYFTG